MEYKLQNCEIFSKLCTNLAGILKFYENMYVSIIGKKLMTK